MARGESLKPTNNEIHNVHQLVIVSITWEEMTERFNERTGKNVSKMTVFRFCKNRGWREVCDKYVPCLTSADVKARREWAEQHVNYAWIGRENLRHDNL